MNLNIFRRWHERRRERQFNLFRDALSEHFKDLSPQRVIHIGGYPVLFQGEAFQDSEINQKDVNVAIAVRLISNAISGLPVKVQRQMSKEGDSVWEDDDIHELNGILRQPNPFHNLQEILCHACQSLIITGNAKYQIAIKGLGTPTAIWPHPSHMIKLIYDKGTGLPSHYLLDPNKRKIVLKMEEVIHLKLYHMLSPFDGIFPNQPVQDQVESNRYALQWNKLFFNNGAVPDLLFEDTNSLLTSQESQEQFLESWAQRHEGVKKSHKRGILPPGIKPHVLSCNIKDMAFAELIRLNREQILGFLQIPPAEAGIYEYANYANAMIQKKTYWENCLIPFIRIIQIGFNHQLVWRYWDIDHRLIIDYSGVEALQADKEVQARAVTLNYNAGLITLNEGRADLGKEPVDGGDEFKQQPAAFQFNPGGGMQSVVGNDNSHALPTKTFISSPYDSMRKGRAARLITYEKKMADKWENYFSAQGKRVLANISKVTSGGLLMSAIYLAYDKATRPQEPSDIFNLFDENEELNILLRPFIGDTIEDVARQALAEAGKDPYFNVDNPWIKEEINRIWNRSKQINEESFAIIKELLRQAYEDDWALGQLENAIRDKYIGWIRSDPGIQSRAMTIARTETNTVVSGATNFGYMQAGIKKKWLASIDERTRESHIQLDAADPVAADASWITITGAEMRYPGDPNGPAEEVVNCRCALIPVET